MCLTNRSSRDRFAASLMRYRVTHRSAAARPGLTQVLGGQLMTTITFLALFAAFIAVVLVMRHLHAKRFALQRDAQLATRQSEIQSALDRAGAILKDERTSPETGEIAAAKVIQELQALNEDGSLAELIADTELFIDELRASKRPA